VVQPAALNLTVLRAGLRQEHHRAAQRLLIRGSCQTGRQSTRPALRAAQAVSPVNGGAWFPAITPTIISPSTPYRAGRRPGPFDASGASAAKVSWQWYGDLVAVGVHFAQARQARRLRAEGLDGGSVP
jgi:hypothetical protein